jgi:MFS family permease
MFFIWIIPSAVAKNIQTMLIARFLDGISGSAFLSVAGGTVGDMFNREQLQLPMLIYTASPFVGPSIGPLFGGFINQYTTWRWTFYMLLIWSGANLAFIALFVPETYHPVLLRKKAQKMRKETGDERWKAPMEKSNKSISKTIAYSLLRPFQLLVLEVRIFPEHLFLLSGTRKFHCTFSDISCSQNSRDNQKGLLRVANSFSIKQY